ncbi:MAG TPA: hypothetical protein VFT22_00675 [Kofleriaceae bacterium]|nr:hypothetical protein [Kofleriaceae bacterium]
MKDVRFVWSLACALGAAALAAGCSSSDATLRVENRSDFPIVELYVAPVGSSHWGDNLLHGDPLDPGDSFVLGVTCDTYDALLVDNAGVDCQLDAIDLCLNNADWIIHNSTCVSFGAAKAAREAAKASGNTGSSEPSGSAAAAVPDAATH